MLFLVEFSTTILNFFSFLILEKYRSSNASRRHSSAILFACRALDVFDDLLARALRCFSHRPLLGGYNERQPLS